MSLDSMLYLVLSPNDYCIYNNFKQQQLNNKFRLIKPTPITNSGPCKFNFTIISVRFEKLYIKSSCSLLAQSQRCGGLYRENLGLSRLPLVNYSENKSATFWVWCKVLEPHIYLAYNCDVSCLFFSFIHITTATVTT